MSRRVGVLLLLSLLAALLLLSTPTRAFNPYEDEGDDVAVGSTPDSDSVQCTTDPTTGEQVCEHIAAAAVPDEEELARRVEAAEAERQETQRRKAAARAERLAREEQEKEARRAKREAQAQREAESHQERQRRSADDYKLSDPLKKLRVDYYRFFGVDRSAPKLRIRKLANQMAAANHPDKCPTPKCRDTMVVLNSARDVLLDDDKRAQYDFLLGWGFKVYDKELYDDIYALYQEGRVDEIPHGFEDDVFDPSSDYSSMNVSEEGAGWLLLLCGALTAAMLAWPVLKWWDRSGLSAADAASKKAALKAQMLAAQNKGRELHSLKKKTEKYTGERGAKRFANPEESPRSSGPATSPTSASARKNAASTAAVAVMCMMGVLLALSAPVSVASAESGMMTSSYYDLLQVAVGADAAAIKKA